MIKTRMSSKVKQHFDLRKVSEQYLLETDFTPSELARICRGEGHETVSFKITGVVPQKTKTYQDYLDERGIKLKPKRVRDTF